ncbi:stage II sporulation protein D [Clostridium paraputrificum]|uniref:stage II sporulation protein D n=1 Tax=Clostridium TaxID=1485 RepID=UPI003D353538
MNKDEIIKNIKIISYMTMFIFIFMILIGSIFIIAPIDKVNSFEVSEDSIKYIKGEGVIVKGSDKVKLYNSKRNEIQEMDLEDYIVGVVAAEMAADFDLEALKAQAVAARTFYFSKRLSPCKNSKGGDICDTTHCQVYMSKEERLANWKSSDGDKNWNKITEAVSSTKGEVLVYDGSIVLYPQFFSTSSGKTEDSVDVFSSDIPYLKSVDSLGEETSKDYETVKEIKIDDFIGKINKSYPNAKVSKEKLLSQVKIDSRTTGGSAKEIILGEVKISGVEFRKIFELKSANFNIEFASDIVKISCKGYGHGVGMSQRGANVMGKEGKKYTDILLHYYSGVGIEKVKYE